MVARDSYRKHVVPRSVRLTTDDLANCGVLIYDSQWDETPQTEIDAVEAFVGNGGGLYLAGLGWSYKAYIDKNLDHFPMNQLGMRFGLRFEDGSVRDPTHNIGVSANPIIHTFYPASVSGITVDTKRAEGEPIAPKATVAKPQSPPESRIWTLSSGRHHTKAEFLQLRDGMVQLAKPDGKTLSVPLLELSKEDQEFVSRIATPIPTDVGLANWQAVADRVERSVVVIKTDRGFGSGFVVDDKGLIATNFHVVQGARKASVKFRDATSLDITGYVAKNPGRDLIILRVNPKLPMPILTLSEQLPRKLDSVLASGSPEGFDFTTSQGAVSAIRSGKEVHDIFLQVQNEDIYGLLKYDLDATWIQTTAPISHGSSGGPLVDMQGKVVGVNTWSWSEIAGQNLNFAIAAREVVALMHSAGDETFA